MDVTLGILERHGARLAARLVMMLRVGGVVVMVMVVVMMMMTTVCVNNPKGLGL